MAGRPRTMAGRVDRIEVAAFKLADAIFQTIPGQYMKGSEDTIGESWHESLTTAIDLWTAVSCLGSVLREKLGVEGDGPTGDCHLTRKQSRPALDDLDFGPLDDKSGRPLVPETGPGDNPSGAAPRARACARGKPRADA